MKRFNPYLYLKAIEKRGITLSEDFKAGFTLAIGGSGNLGRGLFSVVTRGGFPSNKAQSGWHLSKEANTVKSNKGTGDSPLAATVSASALVLIVVVLLGFMFLIAYPIYPRVTGTLSTQLGEPRFSLVSPKLDRLTVAQASNIEKGHIFIYQGPTTPATTFTLRIVVYYGNEMITDQSWDGLQIGQYYFSVVLNPRIEQQNILYNLKLMATFADGRTVEIDSLVPPS